MINFYGYSNLLAALTNSAVAVFLFSRGRGNRLAEIWALFTFCVAIYGFGAFMASGAPDASSAFFWWQVSYVGVIMLPALFTHFVYEFLGMKRSLLVRVVYAACLAILAADLASKSLFVGNVSLKFQASKIFSPAWWIYPPGPLHIFHTVVMYFGVLTFVVIKLLRSYGRSDPLKRTQIKFFSVGMILGFAGGGTSYLPCFGMDLYPVLNCTVPFYTFIIAYAVIRHRLMDIEVIIKKTLVFAGLLAATFAILVLPTLIIQEYLLQGATRGGRLVGLTISGIIIIATMRRIEDFLINITDKYLFQKKYDYKELLRTFTTEVLTVLDLDKLLRLTVDKLTDIIKMKSCAVMIFDEQEQKFRIRAVQGVKDENLTLAKSDNIAAFFEETHGYISVSELKDKKMSVHEEIKGIIDSLDAELIIPMVLHDKVIGILSLGKKKSDEDYTQDDLDILLSLSRTLAIGISNAKLFDELGKTQAEAAQREKMAVIGTLSAGINHEICNPLSIARGQCEAFLLNIKDGLYDNNSAAELLEKAKEIMAKVIKETDRATTITKKLSGFAKPSKGEVELVNVAQEVQDVLGLVGYELKLEKVEISKDIATDLPDIFVDRKQFQEVLFNLIRNAGQAIGEQGKIAITAKEYRGKVNIDIQDTGSGIPEDKIKQLFNPFFTTKEPGKGTGLGLFIVRQVVEKNGGRIALKHTKVGEGTTFTIEFPAAVRQEAGV